MGGVHDRHTPKREQKQSVDDITIEERERRLDAAIKAMNEFDERYGSFADEYVNDIL